MRKYQKAAVVLAMLGSAGFLGAGVSHAGEGPSLDSKQNQTCTGEVNNQQALIGLQDTNVALNLLGVGNPAAGNTAVTCTQAFG
ncbi:hypothetical protein [Streptomyces flaveolus]|jgi:hypothetical protein|uniref:hypothetical protein n=1 Tax=Streptomyces flaveolus TaxID=67297 RepID=UPI0016714B08|nr:hypothetical protein [Streptomyces flaveolus]GGQ68150.1 hypothetical protein GCM10010216_32460 [Streptomyces flaveolus]